MDESAPIKDRIVEFKRVKASDLSPHPQNWREHPDNQRAAMLAIFDEIGYADALKVRKHNGGYQIIDGHLRAETTPDADIPVLVLDLDDDEAKKMLASFDPLGDLAEANEEALSGLVSGMCFENEALEILIKGAAIPADEDWADALEQNVESVKDLSQITFVLCGDDMAKLKNKLGSYEGNHNGAMSQWLADL